MSQELIKWGSKWKKLGVSVVFGIIGAEFGRIKANKVKFVPEKEDCSDLDPSIEVNYLAILLRGTSIVCLDVEGWQDSRSNFLKFLDEKGVDIETLFYEETRNNGFHFYFRSVQPIENRLGLSKNGIFFDVLSRGKIFTTPTTFKNKTYRFGSNNPFTINSLDELPIFPPWAFELINV